MSLQSEINSRTQLLKTRLSNINTSLVGKGGNAANDLSEVPSAIDGLETAAKPNLQYLEVTPDRAAHIYEPEEGYDGFSSVRVNGDGDLLPENIKKGVSIFGVEGELEEGIDGGDSAKTVAIDYSNYASGEFTETLDNGDELLYELELDSEGKPTSIATPDGDTVTVEW